MKNYFDEFKECAIFLSGMVTGLSAEQVEARFDEAADCFDLDSCMVIVPPSLCRDMTDETKIMLKCLKFLSECDVVAHLPNWIYSKGAIAEHALAEKLGKRIVYL